MKPMEKSTWHLRGNCKGDLQVTLPQDRDGGHRHLQLVLLSEVALGVRGQSDDVPFPLNLAVRGSCESRGADRGCPRRGDCARTPSGHRKPPSPLATEIPAGAPMLELGDCPHLGVTAEPAVAAVSPATPGTQTPLQPPPW